MSILDRPAETTAPTPRVHGRGLRWSDAAVGVALVVLLAVCASTPRFFSLDNLRAIATSASLVGTAALGLTLVVLVGTSVSLAVSETVSVCAMVFLATQSSGVATALLVTLLCGAVVTGLQGAVVGYGEANPVVLSIAAGFAVVGAATWVTGGRSVAPTGTGFTVLNATPGGLALSVYVLLGLTVVLELVLRGTGFGRRVYLVGENRRAARAAGLPVGRTVATAWLLAGALFAVASAFSGAFNTTANTALGGTLTFDAIAAVLVGGTSIAGGRGSAVRTLFGALLIAAVSDLLLLRGCSTGVQVAVKGLLVLAVVLLVHVRSSRGAR